MKLCIEDALLRCILCSLDMPDKLLLLRTSPARTVSMIITRWPVSQFLINRNDAELFVSSLDEHLVSSIWNSRVQDKLDIERFIRSNWRHILNRIPFSLLADFIQREQHDWITTALFSRLRVAKRLEQNYIHKISEYYRAVLCGEHDERNDHDFLAALGKHVDFSIEAKGWCPVEDMVYLFNTSKVLVADKPQEILQAVLHIDIFDGYVTKLHSYISKHGDSLFIVWMIGISHGARGILKKLFESLNNCVVYSVEEIKDLLFHEPEDASEHLKQLLIPKFPPSRLSPYDTTGAIRRRAMFFGRVHEMDILSRSIANYAVLGPRRIGKSSLLWAMHSGYANESEIPIYIDCTTKHNVGQLAPDLCSTMMKHCPEFEWLDYGPSFFDQFARELRNSQRKFVFLFDEIDTLLDCDGSRELAGFLRNVAGCGVGRIIVCGYRALYGAINDRMSPLYNLFEEIVLGPLDRPACHRLVEEPMRALAVKIDDKETVEYVVKMGTQVPYILQQMCKLLLTAMHEMQSREITAMLVDRVYSSNEFTSCLLSGLINDRDRDMGAMELLIIYLVADSTEGALSMQEIASEIKKLVPRARITKLRNSMSFLVDTYRLRLDSSDRYRLGIDRQREKLQEHERNLKFWIDSFAEEVCLDYD